jgi:membrane protein
MGSQSLDHPLTTNIFRDLGQMLSQSFAEWKRHNAPRLGAALAFYTVLSMAPLLILVITLASLVFGRSGAQDQILAQATALLGEQGASVVKTILAKGQQPASGILPSIIGIVTLLYGAAGVLIELRSALNTMWDVEPISSAGFRGFLKDQLLSYGMLLATGFLLIVSLTVSAGLAALGKYIDGLFPIPIWLLSAMNVFISFLVIGVLFAFLFEYLPDRRTPWGSVWVGAFATSFLFGLGKFLIELYLGKAAVGSTYGAAGSLVAVVVWVYYSAQIFLFGAEFTRVYSLRRGES